MAAASGTLTSITVEPIELGVAATRPPEAAAKRTSSTPSRLRPLSWTLEPAVATRTSAQRSRQITPVSWGGSGVPTPPPPEAEAIPAPAQRVATATAVKIGFCQSRRIDGAPGSMRS